MFKFVLVQLTLIAVSSCFLLDNLLPFLSLREGPSLSNNPDDVGFYLFPNSNNFSDFEVLEYLDLNSIDKSRFSSEKNVVFLTHGFIQNVSSDFPMVLVKDYLNAGYAKSTNIIGVDWGKLSAAYIPLAPIVGVIAEVPEYIAVVANVPIVGKRIQDFIVFLQNHRKITGPGQVHLIGQSLGAHISGMAGMYYQQNTSAQLDRITGTDPAGPLFQFKPADQRLDSTDAGFVDIVHTNELGFGYNGPLGDVDFFVNGGGPIQPGCGLRIVTNTFCSHNTAPHYYGKSVTNDSLKAYRKTILRNDTVTFGEFCPRDARGSYEIQLTLPASEIPPA